MLAQVFFVLPLREIHFKVSLASRDSLVYAGAGQLGANYSNFSKVSLTACDGLGLS